MENIKIRRANDKDIESILELLYELERPVPKNTSEKRLFKNKISQYITDKDKLILIAEQNSKIVGIVSVLLLPRLNRTMLEMYIPELIVSKDHRKTGIGRLLIDSCIVLAKKKKCFRIRLESGYKRKDAHKFYNVLEFEQSALTFIKNLS